jgi:diadenosine tetraphosphate (Ap4A) HIT family hydrolase
VTSQPACHLCSQIVGDPQNDLIATLLPGQPYIRRVVLDTQSFTAIPSLGPLSDGHLLLCPRTHIHSAAALPSATHAEYEAVKDELVRCLEEEYQAAVHVFEHGMASDGRTVCTVDHAHVHLVPLPKLMRLDMDGAEWQTFDGSLDTLAAITAGREYVSYLAPGGRPLVCVSAADHFESQYMRRKIARALDSESWNWRTEPDARAAHRTWQRCISARHAQLAG